MKELTNEDLEKMYYYMVLTREFENDFAKLHHQGEVTEQLHRSLGQEAVGVGAASGLRRDDLISTAVRTRAALFTKGLSVKTMMAELYDKKTALSEGRAWSDRVGDLELGILPTSNIVGSWITVAAGAALAIRLQHKDQVVVCFFGDGASSRGDFHEGVNLASVLDLPIVFVCVNNQYAASAPLSKQMKNRNITDRALGYGIPGVKVDGNDVIKVYKNVQNAVSKARRGEGPTLLECLTYRWAGHYIYDDDTDPDMGRPQKELRYWRARDPIKKLEKYLRERGILSQEKIQEIRSQIEQEIEAAIQFAKESPSPAMDEAAKYVYTE